MVFFNVDNHIKNRQLTPFTLPVVCLCCFLLWCYVRCHEGTGKQQTEKEQQYGGQWKCYSGYFIVSFTPISLSNSTLTDARWMENYSRDNIQNFIASHRTRGENCYWSLDYCRVIWPWNEPCPTEDKSQMLAGVDGFFCPVWNGLSRTQKDCCDMKCFRNADTLIWALVNRTLLTCTRYM